MRLLAVLLLLLVSACGALPRPFVHDERDAAPAPKAMVPVAVAPVDGAPGLAEALTKALGDEDIVALGSEAPPSGAIRLEGRVETAAEGRRILWRWRRADGTPLGELRQAVPEGGITVADVAGRSAAVLSRALRGEDPNAPADKPTAATRVNVRAVQVVGRFDGAALTRAMAGALSQRMLAVVGSNHPDVLVDGRVMIGNGRDGNDPVEVTWVVRDAAGKELGTVSQGSPVPHELLTGDISPLARQIAIAGAEGVAEVIRKNRPKQ